MNVDNLKKLTQEIVAQARVLSEKHTDERNAPVNYACIFTQSESEYEEMCSLAQQLGTVAQDTAAGPVFHIAPLSTEAGELRLLKIRRPDPQRLQRGDADFNVSDYPAFKQTYVDKPGFSLIKRPKMEMIELSDSSFNVLAYYSNPTLDLSLNNSHTNNVP